MRTSGYTEDKGSSPAASIDVYISKSLPCDSGEGREGKNKRPMSGNTLLTGLHPSLSLKLHRIVISLIFKRC